MRLVCKKHNNTLQQQAMSKLNFENESMIGSILSVSGPVVMAEKMEGSAMYELVRCLYTLVIIYLIGACR